jgi:endoglucanase
MNDHSLQFLKQLLTTPGPSGDEAAVARLWRAEAESFADQVTADVRGSSFAVLQGGAPRVLLAGHIDEIGLMVSYIDEEGFLWFSTIGGWDPQVLVGQRVRLLGRQGEVLGVIGKKPIHLLEGDEKQKVSKIKDMWIDIGVRSRIEAVELVRVGTVGVLDAPVYDFPNGRIVSRSIDDRVGAFTVLEALRLLKDDRPLATVAAVATSQEEITFAGAQTAAFSFDPQVAIAVDVTFATDHPSIEKKEYGDVRLGGGPVLSRGAANSPVVFDMLVAVAEREGIPYSVQINPRDTGTDADVIHMARSGVATGVISIPNRYMHSPNEMVELVDLENVARLIAAFVRSLTPEMDFIPR